MDTAAAKPEIENLGVHDCWRYLRYTSPCRVAFTSGQTVEIFPANYVPTDGTLLIRPGEGSKLGSLSGRTVVAVETDGLNQYCTIAWRVVKGQAAVVTYAEEVQDARDAGLSPWQPGQKPFFSG